MSSTLILASQSPRRRELLELLKIPFEVVEPSFAEEILKGRNAAEEVQILAQGKGQSVLSQYPESPVLAADTLVSLAGTKMGKPGTPEEALAMLERLSGQTHEVLTGMYLKLGSQEQVWAECTQVTFKTLQSEEMRDYVASGEPFGKAGAYAIQGLGSRLIAEIQGDYFNVVGLPLLSLHERLARSGWDLPMRREELLKHIPSIWT